MGIKLPKEIAARRLSSAVQWAIDPDRSVSDYWTETTALIASGPSKTLVAGLGTALLARSISDQVDALSIKEKYSPNSFSIRTLGHTVLVPASQDQAHPFDLGVRKREPLNNQPYFRYDHLSLVERTRAGASLDLLRERLDEVNSYTTDQALEALAAFLRQRMGVEEARRAALLVAAPGRDDLREIFDAIDHFLTPDARDLPLRYQAVAGGLARLAGQPVSTQGLYDPSRHAPGDVHVPDAVSPYWAAEARTKPVSLTEALNFVQSCADNGASSAWICVLSPHHHPLDRDAIYAAGRRVGVVAGVAESVGELVGLLAGHPSVTPAALATAGQLIADQLRLIDASVSTLREFRSLFS